jgi:hypothetical protein
MWSEYICLVLLQFASPWCFWCLLRKYYTHALYIWFYLSFYTIVISLSYFFPISSGWSHWLWGICCYDDEGQLGSWEKNNEKQLEHKLEGNFCCTLKSEHPRCTYECCQSEVWTSQVFEVILILSTDSACNFLMLSVVAF